MSCFSQFSLSSLALAKEERKDADNLAKGSPETDEREDAIAGGHAPTEPEIFLLEAMILPLASMGPVPSVLAAEESNTAAGSGEDSPGKENRDGAIAGGDAPSESEISLSKAMISALEVMEKIRQRGTAGGV